MAPIHEKYTSYCPIHLYRASTVCAPSRKTVADATACRARFSCGSSVIPQPSSSRHLRDRVRARDCNFNGSVALSVVAGCADVSRSVMIDVTELVRTVFSGLSTLVIDDVEDAGDVICVRARTRDGAVACPGCGAETARVHEYHERTAADVPVDGRRVLVRVRVRRMPGAGLQGADLPRAGPGHPGPLPAAH